MLYAVINHGSLLKQFFLKSFDCFVKVLHIRIGDRQSKIKNLRGIYYFLCFDLTFNETCQVRPAVFTSCTQLFFWF